MTNFDKIQEIVNSENAIVELADLLVNKLRVDMEIFDKIICSQCMYSDDPDCPNPCIYADTDEVEIWLTLEEEPEK